MVTRHHATRMPSGRASSAVRNATDIVLSNSMPASRLRVIPSAHSGARNRAHVVTAKAGIVGFTRALAHDLGPDGITVNCVVPGFIGTPRPKDAPQPAHHLTHSTISGERGKPEDVAAMVRFLCGPAARYVTGQAIHANGGAYLGA